MFEVVEVLAIAFLTIMLFAVMIDGFVNHFSNTRNSLAYLIGRVIRVLKDVRHDYQLYQVVGVSGYKTDKIIIMDGDVRLPVVCESKVGQLLVELDRENQDHEIWINAKIDDIGFEVMDVKSYHVKKRAVTK